MQQPLAGGQTMVWCSTATGTATRSTAGWREGQNTCRRPLSAHARYHQRHIVHNLRQRQSIVLSRPDGFATTVMAQSCEARVVSRTRHLIGCVTSCFVHVASVQTRPVLGALYMYYINP